MEKQTLRFKLMLSGPHTQRIIELILLPHTVSSLTKCFPTLKMENTKKCMVILHLIKRHCSTTLIAHLALLNELLSEKDLEPYLLESWCCMLLILGWLILLT